MSARGILENPALFAGFDSCPWEAVESFLNHVVKKPIPFKLVVHHLNEMVGSDRVGGVGGLGKGGRANGTLLSKEERMGLLACKDMLELIDFLEGVREIRRL
jgi:tRNA-dihydrouridine synthase 4